MLTSDRSELVFVYPVSFWPAIAGGSAKVKHLLKLFFFFSSLIFGRAPVVVVYVFCLLSSLVIFLGTFFWYPSLLECILLYMYSVCYLRSSCFSS